MLNLAPRVYHGCPCRVPCLSYNAVQSLSSQVTSCYLQHSQSRNPLPLPLSSLSYISYLVVFDAEMSFQDIEAGVTPSQTSSRISSVPQSQEESAFLTLQSSLSLQVFKINANVQGILKLVDQLGTGRDSAQLRKSLYVSSSYVITRSLIPFIGWGLLAMI